MSAPDPKRLDGAITRWVNMEMTTMTLKVQYLTKLEDGTQIRAGWYVTTPFCPGVVFATEQEALAYGRTEELRQELMDRARAMSFDERRALKEQVTQCRTANTMCEAGCRAAPRPTKQ